MALEEKLREQLTCPVCLEIFRNPKVLSCLHEACANCLAKCVKVNNEGQQRVEYVDCPICRASTNLPEKGVFQLTNAFNSNQLIDVYNSREGSNNVKEEKGALASSSFSKQACSVHPDQFLDFWCKQCEEVICSHCDLEGEKHYRHSRSLVSKEYKQYSEEITDILEPLEKQSISIEDALKTVGESAKELHITHKAVVQSLEDTSRLLCDMVRATTTDYIENIDELVEIHSKKVNAQKESLQLSHEQRQQFIGAIKGKLQDEDQAIIVSQMTDTKCKAKSLEEDLQPSSLNSYMEAYARGKFDIDQFRRALRNSMSVYLTDVCPSKCVVDLETCNARVGSSTKLFLKAFTAHGNPSMMPSRNIMCTVARENERLRGLPMEVCLERSYPDMFMYSATLNFNCKGQHVLILKVEDEHVPRSPFTFHVRPSRKQLKLSYIDEIHTETIFNRMAVLYDGRIVISTTTSLRVFDQCGKLVKHIDGWTFSAIKPSCELLAVDQTTKSVFEIDISNEKKTECIFSRIYQDNKENITDIAKMRCNIYVLYCIHYKSVSWNQPKQFCIRTFSQNRCTTQTYKGPSFGEVGSGREQLNSATYITADDDNLQLYVADKENHRIQVYDNGCTNLASKETIMAVYLFLVQ